MQQKLELDMVAEDPVQEDDDTPKDSVQLTNKLNELIHLYKTRVNEIKREHSTISFDNDVN